MIKRMERRFTIVAVTVVSVVLLVLLTSVNVITMRSNIQRANESLDRIAVEDFDLERPEPVFPNDGFSLSDRISGEEGKRPLQKDSSRSFDVYVNGLGEFISTNADNKSLLDEESAYLMALEAVEKGSDYGFVDEYRFLVIKVGTETRVIFLDYSFEQSSEWNFAMTSIGVFFLSIIIVIILVRAFMKPIMKPIREAYMKQRRFITDASHELKTPLTVISTDIQLIEMEGGASNWTESINNQVKRLKALSNDLVTLSRMEEEDTRLQMTKINLSDIVNDVVMGFEPAIKAKGKVFDCDIEEGIEVKGDHDALENLLSVLMNNALKYSSKNGEVEVTLARKGKQVELTVFNSADNVEKGSHDEYFERFYRGDKSRNSKTGGFGIGLAVAKSTVEEHKGRIEAKSHDGKSLTIRVTLNHY